MARVKAMARKEVLEKARAREAMAKGAMARARERDMASIRVEKGQEFMGWMTRFTTSSGQYLVGMQVWRAPRNGLPRWAMGGIRGAMKVGTTTAGGGEKDIMAMVEFQTQ